MMMRTLVPPRISYDGVPAPIFPGREAARRRWRARARGDSNLEGWILLLIQAGGQGASSLRLFDAARKLLLLCRPLCANNHTSS